MSIGSLIGTLFIYGFFLGGLSNLVSSACSADLAKSADIQNNAKGAATIMGII